MEKERTRMPAAKRQNDIIEKAIQVLADGNNYRSATTAKIAREAGVSEPTIYKYFGSKKELFLAVLERIRDDMLSEWRQVASGIREPDKALRTLASYHYRFIQENKAIEKILFQAVSEVDDPDIKEELLAMFKSMVEFVTNPNNIPSVSMVRFLTVTLSDAATVSWPMSFLFSIITESLLK